MRRYYYVITAYPTLSMGAKPEMSYREAREIAFENLTKRDWQLVEELQRVIDLRNIRAIWLDQELDARGSYEEKELTEALLVQEGLPPFIIAFLKKYESLEERLRCFSELYSSFFNQKRKGFLGRYYQLEREIRLVLTALRSRASGRSLLQEFQFEDLTDPFVAELFSQGEIEGGAIPPRYEALKNAFLENRSKPRDLYFASLGFRFSRIMELEQGDPFGMDRVLGYLARLLLVEDWYRLDDKLGRSVLEQRLG